MVQIKNNKNYIDAERVKDVVGIGKKELTFNLKDGENFQTNFWYLPQTELGKTKHIM